MLYSVSHVCAVCHKVFEEERFCVTAAYLQIYLLLEKIKHSIFVDKWKLQRLQNFSCRVVQCIKMAIVYVILGCSPADVRCD